MRRRSVIALTFASATFRSRSSIRSPILQLHIQLWFPLFLCLFNAGNYKCCDLYHGQPSICMAKVSYVCQRIRWHLVHPPSPDSGHLGSTVNCNLLSLQPMCCKSCAIDLLPLLLLLLLYRFRWPSSLLLLLLPWLALCYSIKGFGLTQTHRQTETSRVWCARLAAWLSSWLATSFAASRTMLQLPRDKQKGCRNNETNTKTAKDLKTESRRNSAFSF